MEFRQRMDKVRESKKLAPIQVLLPKEKSKNERLAVKFSTSPSTAPYDEKEQHRRTNNKWLDCVDNFADMLQNLKVEKLIAEFSKTYPSLKNLQRDVVVAVIDDGVDINQQCLRGRILRGETFDTSDRSHYRFSTKDHGTLMASQIVRVCPNAKIYVIKVNTCLNDDNLTIDTESAASAIQAAVRQHVDIIVMSWTTPKMAEYKVFGDAMNAALRDGILLFCSAADEGGCLKILDSYPAAHSPKNVFKIGAAKASGQNSEWTPLEEVDYILPGHEVYEKKPKYGPVPKTESHSGSSIANALAAGLAALILHCARLVAIHTMIDPQAKRKVSVEELKSLKSYEENVQSFWEVFNELQDQK